MRRRRARGRSSAAALRRRAARRSRASAPSSIRQRGPAVSAVAAATVRLTRRAPSGSAPPRPRAASGSASEAVTAISQKRRADAAAAPAERVVGDRDASRTTAGRRRGAPRRTRNGAAEARRTGRGKPRRFSHISAAAAAAAVADSHASRRTLIQPGEKRSSAEQLAQQHRDVEEQREVDAVERAERHVPAPHALRDRAAAAGLSCSTRIVRYAAPSAPATSELLSMRRYRIGRKCILPRCRSTSPPR